jgi:NADH dehydrogenase
MPETTRIVVLGGGYGGVQSARMLDRRLGARRDVEITLIDRNSYQTLMTELHEVAGGRVEPESVRISFHKMFAARKVKLVCDRVRTIDFETRRLSADGGEYEYDYLVLGAGGEPEFYGIPGIKENALTICSFDDAMRIRRHVEDTFRRASAEPDRARRAEMLTFVVAGAGFTGIELAGELMDQRRVLCAAHHLDEAEVRIIVVEALDAVIPNLPQRLQKKFQRYLERRGVEFRLRSPIIGAEKDKVILGGNVSITTRTFIWTCGIQGCEFAGNLRLTKGKCSNLLCRFATTQGSCGVKECTFSKDRYVEGKRGRLLVNAYMQSVDYSNVYVVGDGAWYLEGRRVIPQIVETAVQTAETAAHNIIAQIEGEPMKTFRSRYHGLMVSLGTYYCVAYVMGISLSGLPAMAVKHMINVVHLFGVGGVNQVWEYVKHEFLDVRDGRSFVGGIASYKIRGYWPLLLRLWLGLMWILESTNKITSGWLDFKTGTSASAWMFSSGVVQAGLPVADATSAASAAEGAATAVAAAPAAADATAAASAATGAASAAAAAPAAPGPWLDPTHNIINPSSGLVTWFRHTFMDGIAAHIPYTWFQAIVVSTEMLVGLALFGGLFTWWAAAVSIVLCIVFTLSGMFAWNQLWFVFAGVLMLGGVGRAFGLDSWVVPIFKRWWNGTWLARRTRFYADEPTK